MEIKAVTGVAQTPQVASGTTAQRRSPEAAQSLGRQEFLDLLVTQLRHQNPLNPIEDTEFIAQLAQFSSLEAMQQMNQNTQKNVSLSLLGRFVRAISDGGAVIQGTATGLRVQEGETFVKVGAKEVRLDQIIEIETV